jgi:hypothetical protein
MALADNNPVKFDKFPMKKRRLIFYIILGVAILGLVFLRPVFHSLSDYLSKSERVHANILLVEGWLPPYAIEMAYKEFQNNGYEQIITTGIDKTIDYYNVFSNGYLVFYPGRRFVGITELKHHVLEVNAYSEMEGENSAHFNVFINNSLVADFRADKHKRKYEISWEGKLAEIDSIMVQFDNDRHGAFGDRNLYVKEIIIDHKTKIPCQNNSAYNIGALDGKRRIINNYNSYAEMARNEFLAMGIDSSVIIAVPGRRVALNRTLTSALAFRDWIKTSGCKVAGINIVSEGTHARRTWMTYTRLLNNAYRIGVISLPDYHASNSRKYKLFKTLREALGIVYYRIILNFY